MAYTLAMRSKEIQNARPEWIKERKGRTFVQIPVNSEFVAKSKRFREVPMHPRVAQVLKAAGMAHRDPETLEGYIVAGTCLRQREDLVVRHFSEWMRSTGWKRQKCAHELRALMGCRWFTEQSPAVAQMLLGHTKLSTTEQYYALYTKTPDPLEMDFEMPDEVVKPRQAHDPTSSSGGAQRVGA